MVTQNSCNYDTGASGTVLTGNGAGVTPTFQAIPAGSVTLNPDSGQGSPVSGSTIAVQAASDANFPNNCGSSVWFFGDTTTSPQTLLLNVTDASQNTIIGINSGNSSITGTSNVGLGNSVLTSLGAGTGNTMIGDHSGTASSHTSYSTGVGYFTLQNSASDQFNTAIGWGALTGCNGGSSNTAIGGQANNGGSPNNNVAVGTNALLGNGGNGNIGIGVNTLSNSTLDSFNVGIGHNSLTACNGGAQNIAIGSLSLTGLIGGNNNIAIGYQTMQSSTSAFYNTVVGTLGMQTGAGQYNTVLGYIAGSNYSSSESSNVLINSAGVALESNVLHIGDTTGTGYNAINSAFICGITSNTQNTDGATVGVVTVQNSGGASPNLLGISLLNGAFTWTVVTGATQALSNNHGYISNAASGGVTYTLPSTAPVGAIICITGLAGGSGWVVAQNASQSIQIANQTTTVGTGGSLTSTGNTDSLYLVCAVANTTWIATFFTGNITVV